MDAGKAGLSHYGKSDPVKSTKKKNRDLRRIIGDLTIANDSLKNLGGRQRLNAVKIMQEWQLRLRKSLRYAGISRRRWYYEPNPRAIGLDPDVLDTVLHTSKRRPRTARGAWRPR